MRPPRPLPPKTSKQTPKTPSSPPNVIMWSQPGEEISMIVPAVSKEKLRRESNPVPPQKKLNPLKNLKGVNNLKKGVNLEPIVVLQRLPIDYSHLLPHPQQKILTPPRKRKLNPPKPLSEQDHPTSISLPNPKVYLIFL